MSNSSTDDTYMALRVMVYVGLLYQYLIGEKLPPMLPIVLYNGERPWKSVLTSALSRLTLYSH